MTLGENIRSGRKKLGLSQEAFAEMLDVSRQAVYKWESDQAQPELEKLIKMSDIFGVSLDELIKGTMAPAADVLQEMPKEKKRPSRTSGVIMLCAGIVLAIVLTMLSSSAAGIIIAMPFFACAIICFSVETHTKLWYCWVWFVFLYGYLRFGTGLSPWTVLRTFVWTWEMNYVRLAIAWAMFIVTAVMIVATVRSFRPRSTEPTTKRIVILCLMWVLTVALQLFSINGVILRCVHDYVAFFRDYGVLVTLLNTLQEFAVYVLIIIDVRKTWALLKK